MSSLYFQNTRLDIQKHISACSTILEIGCAKGILGKELKSKFPGLTYYGVDFHKPSLDFAKSNIDFTFWFDFNKSPLESFDNIAVNFSSKFDYIIFGDVLEHLISPIDVILYFNKYLSDGGQIIISIPNICHISVLSDLLINRDFKYADEGILDRTHLAFFTKKSFVRELVKIGFREPRVFYQNGWKSRFLSLIFGKWVLDYFSRQIIYVLSK